MSGCRLSRKLLRMNPVFKMHLRKSQATRLKSRTERRAGMSIVTKNAWRKSAVSPKIGNIIKKFPIFGETLLYLQQ